MGQSLASWALVPSPASLYGSLVFTFREVHINPVLARPGFNLRRVLAHSPNRSARASRVFSSQAMFSRMVSND